MVPQPKAHAATINTTRQTAARGPQPTLLAITAPIPTQVVLVPPKVFIIFP